MAMYLVLLLLLVLGLLLVLVLLLELLVLVVLLLQLLRPQLLLNLELLLDGGVLLLLLLLLGLLELLELDRLLLLLLLDHLLYRHLARTPYCRASETRMKDWSGLQLSTSVRKIHTQCPKAEDESKRFWDRIHKEFPSVLKFFHPNPGPGLQQVRYTFNTFSLFFFCYLLLCGFHGPLGPRREPGLWLRGALDILCRPLQTYAKPDRSQDPLRRVCNTLPVNTVLLYAL